VQLLDAIPGVALGTSEIIVSEIGTDMSRFPTANHLATWAGVAQETTKAPESSTRDEPDKVIKP
jgi:transposase